LFIHVGFLEYLSSKQFELIVKITRIETGVTIPKGLFTLYLNVKKVTAKIFWPPYYINTKKKNTVVSDAAAEGTNTNPSGNSEDAKWYKCHHCGPGVG
jgi:hypothetical protein